MNAQDDEQRIAEDHRRVRTEKPTDQPSPSSVTKPLPIPNRSGRPSYGTTR